jgi:hypothetical protein
VAGDIVEIICPLQITTTDTYTQSAADNKFVQNSGNFAAGKNKLINGDFNINQRNFTSSTTQNQYNFDRWQQFNGGTTGTLTITPQTFTIGAAPVSGYEGKNYVQCVTAASASSDTYAIFAQKIESVRTLAGQAATISFWAKTTSGTPKIGVELAQSFGGGGSPSAEVDTSAGAVTLSTSWTRYSVTVSIPSISGKTIGTNNDDSLIVSLWLSAGSNFNTRASSIGLQNATFQIWGVQIESGSSTTAFQTATGTIQGELAACQRYYYRWTSGATYARYPTLGVASSTTIGSFPAAIPVTMRITPYSVEYGGNFRLYDMVNTPLNMTSIALFGSTELSPTAWINIIVASGLTQLRTYSLNSRDDVSAYIGINAEL